MEADLASISHAAPPSADDIRRAADAGAGVIRETPVLSSRTLAERTGINVALKAENLQRTGSFKIRGALAKIASLGAACDDGVVCASAGNHAQAVAYARSCIPSTTRSSSPARAAWGSSCWPRCPTCGGWSCRSGVVA